MKIINRIKKIINHRLENHEWDKWINKVVKENQNLWTRCNEKKEGDNVFIANTIHDANEFLYEGLVFAKGMEEEKFCNIWVLSMKNDRGIKALVSSFGAKYQKILRTDFRMVVKTLCYVLDFARKGATGSKLLQAECSGIVIGPVIYDTILVEVGEYTINKMNTVRQFFILWKYVYATYKLEELFNYYKPTDCIVMEEAYEAELYRRISVKHNTNVLWVNKMVKQYVDFEGKPTVFFQEVLEREILESIEKIKGVDYEKETERMINSYYKMGDGEAVQGRTLTGLAVNGKIYASKEEIEKTMKIDLNKKNVFVFAHCLTDGPHTCPELFYQDFFQWLDETLKLASQVSGINWIVKFHPDRFIRNIAERKGENIIKKKYGGIENIYFFPDNYSIASVVPIADVIVTACGEVGEEMSCFGIPTVAAGKPYYAKMSYAHSFSQKEKYEETLKMIECIEKMSEEEVKDAKKFFYAHSISSRLIDGDIIGNHIVECNNRRLKEQVPPRTINIYFLKKMVEDNMIRKVRESKLFGLGMEHRKGS